MESMDGNPVLKFIRGLLVEPSKVNDAVAFYRAGFGAQEVSPPPFAAAELKMAGTNFLIIHLPSNFSDEDGENKMTTTLASVNVAATVQRLVSLGAVQEQVEENVAAAYAGGPIAKVRDPFGFSWYICKSTFGPHTSVPQFM